MSTPSIGLDDAEIITRIRRGEHAVFDVLFRAYFDRLLRHANVLVQAPDIAEDIVCGVFEAVLEQHTRWSPRGSVEAYLMRAVRNEALKVLRGRQREAARYARLAAEEDESVLAGEAPSPDTLADEQDEHNRRYVLYRRALETLPIQTRAIIALRWEEAREITEIAELLGTSVPAVRMQLSRAVRALRRAVETLA